MGRLNDRLRDLPFDLNLDRDFPAGDRPRLGVTVQALTPQLAAYFGAKDGVLVASVTDDSPASRAGLKAGDVILSVNGQPVASASDAGRELQRIASGRIARILIWRGDGEVFVTVRKE